MSMTRLSTFSPVWHGSVRENVRWAALMTRTTLDRAAVLGRRNGADLTGIPSPWNSALPTFNRLRLMSAGLITRDIPLALQLWDKHLRPRIPVPIIASGPIGPGRFLQDALENGYISPLSVTPVGPVVPLTTWPMT